MKQQNPGTSRLRWLCLCIVILILPLLITAAAHSRTQPDVQLAATPAPTAPAVSDAQPLADEPVQVVAAVGDVTVGDTAVEDISEASFEDVPAPQEMPASVPVAAAQEGASAQETAQPQDVAATWSYETSRITINITQHKLDNLAYFAADIQLSDPTQFSYAFANERFGAGTEQLSDIAERNDPLLAINGDFCGFHDNGVIIRGGELFRKQNSARQMLIVDKNGDLSVLTDRSEKQGLVAQRLMDEGVLHTFEFGPVLVENGEAVEMQSAIVRVDEGYLEPRTAIGQLGPLHYLVIVVDGRNEGYSEGCDLPTLQRLFLEHGAQIAFNLDGGGSTTLWFNGEIINRPASGSERKVSDIVMFMR